MAEFDLGDTIEVDVSDYEKIEYPKILQWLEDRVWKKQGNFNSPVFCFI